MVLRAFAPNYDGAAANCCSSVAEFRRARQCLFSLTLLARKVAAPFRLVELLVLLLRSCNAKAAIELFIIMLQAKK